MAATSFHPLTGRYLTSSCGPDWVEGATPTLSIGHPLTGGEFTTYRLGKVIDQNGRGENLFDLDDAEIEMGGAFYPRSFLRSIRDERPSGFVLAGVRYRRSGFGNYYPETATDRPASEPLRTYEVEAA